MDSNSADGLRKCLFDEFSRLYIFNLRGFIRGNSGDKAKREGQNIFDIMTGIAITLLVKNPDKTEECELFYHEIGDYLKRSEKLEIIQKLGRISGIEWQKIEPNDSHDWINQRNPVFESFVCLGDKKDKFVKTIFDVYSRSVATGRDAWCYNFSCKAVNHNMGKMIGFYNQQVETYQLIRDEKTNIEEFINTDPTKISWTRGIKNDSSKGRLGTFNSNQVVASFYRPFCKQYFYLDKQFNDYAGQMPKIFPCQNLKNVAICVTGAGAQRSYSALIVDIIADDILSKTQYFPLYTYTPQSEIGDLFQTLPQSQYVRNDNISDVILTEFQTIYSNPK